MCGIRLVLLHKSAKLLSCMPPEPHCQGGPYQNNFLLTGLECVRACVRAIVRVGGWACAYVSVPVRRCVCARARMRACVHILYKCK